MIVSPNVITVEADIEPCPTETHVLPRRERIDNEIDKIEVIEPNVQQEDARISTMVSRDNRWYVSLNVLGTPIIGLVDTGATYSYMSSQLQNCFKALRLSTYSIPAENVIVANGTVERVNSVTSLPYQLKIKGG